MISAEEKRREENKRNENENRSKILKK